MALAAPSLVHLVKAARGVANDDNVERTPRAKGAAARILDYLNGKAWRTCLSIGIGSGIKQEDKW